MSRMLLFAALLYSAKYCEAIPTNRVLKLDGFEDSSPTRRPFTTNDFKGSYSRFMELSKSGHLCPKSLELLSNGEVMLDGSVTIPHTDTILNREKCNSEGDLKFNFGKKLALETLEYVFKLTSKSKGIEAIIRNILMQVQDFYYAVEETHISCGGASLFSGTVILFTSDSDVFGEELRIPFNGHPRIAFMRDGQKSCAYNGTWTNAPPRTTSPPAVSTATTSVPTTSTAKTPTSVDSTGPTSTSVNPETTIAVPVTSTTTVTDLVTTTAVSTAPTTTETSSTQATSTEDRAVPVASTITTSGPPTTTAASTTSTKTGTLSTQATSTEDRSVPMTSTITTSGPPTTTAASTTSTKTGTLSTQATSTEDRSVPVTSTITTTGPPTTTAASTTSTKTETSSTQATSTEDRSIPVTSTITTSGPPTTTAASTTSTTTETSSTRATSTEDRSVPVTSTVVSTTGDPSPSADVSVAKGTGASGPSGATVTPTPFGREQPTDQDSGQNMGLETVQPTGDIEPIFTSIPGGTAPAGSASATADNPDKSANPFPSDDFFDDLLSASPFNMIPTTEAKGDGTPPQQEGNLEPAVSPNSASSEMVNLLERTTPSPASIPVSLVGSGKPSMSPAQTRLPQPGITPEVGDDTAPSQTASNFEVTISESDSSPQPSFLLESEQVPPTPSRSIAPNSASGEGSTCFPSYALAKLESGKLVRMDHLRIGDIVHIGNGFVSPIVGFSHADGYVITQFLKFTTESGDVIAVTPTHFLYTTRGLRASREISTADSLRLENGTHSPILKIEGILAKGLFNPHTAQGDIVVDGFTASTYTSAVTPNAAHALLAPVRLLERLGVHLPVVSYLSANLQLIQSVRLGLQWILK